MVDKLTKFLRKQNKKIAQLVLDLIENLRKGNLEGCDIKQLTGKSSLFRLRKGRIRILFENRNGNIIIKKITHRDDQTYRNL